MATVRPNRVSRARKTWPMPPSPSLLSILYGPQARAHSQFSKGQIFQQLRGVLNGRLIRFHHGTLQETSGLSLQRQQRLDFAFQGFVAGTRLPQKGLALLGLTLEHRLQ